MENPKRNSIESQTSITTTMTTKDGVETDGISLQEVAQKSIQLLTRTYEANVSVQWSYLITLAISVLTRPATIVMNVVVALSYKSKGETERFLWTVLCMAIPAIVTTALFVRMYLDDELKRENKSSRWQKLGYVLIHILLLKLTLRHYMSLLLGWNCKLAERRKDQITQQRYYEEMVKEDSDMALVRIYDSLLDEAPQTILQLTIVLSDQSAGGSQIAAIVKSVALIAWSLSSYYRCIRFAQRDKRHIPWLGSIIQTMYHFLFTMSRVLLIALATIHFPLWALGACSMHALAMACWIFSNARPPFCGSPAVLSFLFSLSLGVIYLFTYIQTVPGPTFLRHTVYYTLYGLETVAGLGLLWMYTTDTDTDSIHHRRQRYLLWSCILCVVAFALGVIFLLVYYKHCHPRIMSRVQQTSHVEPHEVVVTTNPVTSTTTADMLGVKSSL